MSRRPHGRYCFEQAIGYLSTQPPSGRAQITLTLTAHDHYHRSGTLSATVRLRG
jgi:hypothetical protein